MEFVNPFCRKCSTSVDHLRQKRKINWYYFVKLVSLYKMTIYMN